jgi:hypothetical protein
MFIPPGYTERLQSLDRRVFGVLKACTRQMWRTQYHETMAQKVTKAMVAEGLSEAWNQITTGTIDCAWCVYLPEYRQVIALEDLRGV